MSNPTMRDLLTPADSIGAGIEAVAAILESNGWYPRTRWGDNGVRYWPPNGRPKQIVLNFNQDLSMNLLEWLHEQTGIEAFRDLIDEGAKK